MSNITILYYFMWDKKKKKKKNTLKNLYFFKPIQVNLGITTL